MYKEFWMWNESNLHNTIKVAFYINISVNLGRYEIYSFIL